MTAYALYTSIFLIAGYLIYKWLMAREKQSGLNRATLLAIYAIAFAAYPAGELLRDIFGKSSGNQADIELLLEGLTPVAAEVSSEPLWPKVVVGIYLAGLVLVFAWTVFVMLRLLYIVRSGEHFEGPEGTHLVLLDSRSVAPFSWGSYIVMTRRDYEAGGDVIIAHELAHVGHRHSLDLLIAQLVCILQWFNPASWLLREELKAVHEFQADDTVIASGIEIKQYQMLLIKKAVGTRFQSLANSLTHSNLKKRITMMYNSKSSGTRRLRGLALVPALALALAVTNLPAVASVLSATSSVQFASSAEGQAVAKSESAMPAETVADDKVSEKSADNKIDLSKLDKMPSYPGGDMEMFTYLMRNLKYPKEAENRGAEGRVVVGFTVDTDGSLKDIKIVRGVDEALDAEAIRVVKTMPRWEPATLKGKPVAISYTLPVTFKLAPDKMKKTENTNATNDAAEVYNNLKAAGNGASENQPAIFVDGQRFTGDLKTISPEDIKSMQVVKDDPAFPAGRLNITLKK